MVLLEECIGCSHVARHDDLLAQPVGVAIGTVQRTMNFELLLQPPLDLPNLKAADIVVVPHPKKDLGPGLVAAIRKQAGI